MDASENEKFVVYFLYIYCNSLKPYGYTLLPQTNFIQNFTLVENKTKKKLIVNFLAVQFYIFDHKAHSYAQLVSYL